MQVQCSPYTGFCTITSSNLKAIKVGFEGVYASSAGDSSLDSDLILYSGHDEDLRPRRPRFRVRDRTFHVRGGQGSSAGSTRASPSHSIRRPVYGTGTGDSRSGSVQRQRKISLCSSSTVSADSTWADAWVIVRLLGRKEGESAPGPPRADSLSGVGPRRIGVDLTADRLLAPHRSRRDEFYAPPRATRITLRVVHRIGSLHPVGA